jgi:hypothetical protein
MEKTNMRIITTFQYKNKLSQEKIAKLTAYRGSKVPGPYLTHMAEIIGTIPPHKDRLRRYTWFPPHSA